MQRHALGSFTDSFYLFPTGGVRLRYMGRAYRSLSQRASRGDLQVQSRPFLQLD